MTGSKNIENTGYAEHHLFTYLFIATAAEQSKSVLKRMKEALQQNSRFYHKYGHNCMQLKSISIVY